MKNESGKAAARAAWHGRTRELREQFRAQVDEPTYEAIVLAARQILQALPKGHNVGTLAAGLQLAAVSYAEFGATGIRALVDEAGRK